MAGEMIKKDLEKGGEWYEVVNEMYAFALEGGFSGEAKPFDQYQGPYYNLIEEGLIVGSIWLSENGCLCKVQNGRMEESKVVSSGYELHKFVLSVWRKWNEGFNPEKIDEDEVSEKNDEFLVLKNGKKYIKSPIGNELYCIVKNFKKQMLDFDHKYWVIES